MHPHADWILCLMDMFVDHTEEPCSKVRDLLQGNPLLFVAFEFGTER